MFTLNANIAQRTDHEPSKVKMLKSIMFSNTIIDYSGSSDTTVRIWNLLEKR